METEAKLRAKETPESRAEAAKIQAEWNRKDAEKRAARNAAIIGGVKKGGSWLWKQATKKRSSTTSSGGTQPMGVFGGYGQPSRAVPRAKTRRNQGYRAVSARGGQIIVIGGQAPRRRARRAKKVARGSGGVFGGYSAFG